MIQAQTRKAAISKPVPAIYLIAAVVALMIASNAANVLAAVNPDKALLNSGQTGFQ